jgi:thioesterase domain-containing protein
MCAGSFIALEMCNRIEEAGQSIARLILLDPPTMPPTMKDRLAEAKAKDTRWRAIRAFFGIGPDRDEARDVKRKAKQRDKMLRIRDTVVPSLEELDWISCEERPYSKEALANVAEKLRMALDAHVPRPFSGSAAILVNSTKESKILDRTSFWRSHLGTIEHCVCGADHHDVFRKRLLEAARFISISLDPAKSCGTATTPKKQVR